MPAVGFIHAIASGAFFATMGFLVRLNPAQISVSQQVFTRAFISCLCLLPFVWKQIPLLFRYSARSLWLRSIAGAFSVWFYFYSLSGTNTATANMLYSSSPLVVLILAIFVSNVKIGRTDCLGMILILLGNVILYLPNTNNVSLSVGLAGTAGAILAGLAMHSLSTAARLFSPTLIVFSFSLACCLVGVLVPAPSAWFFPHGTTTILALLGMGLAGLAAQLTLTLSFLYLKSPVASALARSAILWGALFEIIFLEQKFGIWDWTCYALVLVGIYVLQLNDLSPTKKLLK
jgi:drug/metabolite transporter (DMT)-like permease